MISRIPCKMYKAALAALCFLLLGGCLAQRIDRLTVDGISIFEVQRNSGVELRVRSRQIGYRNFPDHCAFEAVSSYANDWLTFTLLEPTGENCLVPSPEIPDHHRDIRDALLSATVEHIKAVAYLFEDDRTFTMELKLVPEQYNFQLESVVNPEATAFRVQMSVPVALNAHYNQRLALSLSGALHETMHFLAYGQNHFDSLAHEELFGYLLDRCFRIRMVNDLEFWMPNFSSEPTEEWFNQILTENRNVNEILANIDKGSTQRASVQGMGTAMVLFGWAINHWRDAKADHFDREILLNEWCDLVLSEPQKVFANWPDI